MAPIVDDLPLEHTYASLPEAFHSRVAPTPVAEPGLVRLNETLAQELGLDPKVLGSEEGVRLLAGNRVPQGADPVAMVYAGHQFGGWVPQLGDGRAILLGEVVDPSGTRWDLQLKGAGQTPYSRRGDGRSSIGPVVREYLGSEAMSALGIPTTRALACLTTGEQVFREGPEPGGILVRVATSHVRVGTFEYFGRRGDRESVQRLAEYVIQRHYPHLEDGENPYLGLLEEATRRTAEMVASWMLVGFIHGVMNTDNTSIVGETIDYGPFGFLDPYRPGEVYSSIDWQGRYAYDQQPGIAHWNLARLAEVLLPLLDADEEAAVERAQDALELFPQRFLATYHAGLLRKIGLSGTHDGDLELALDLLRRMKENEADFTRTFRELSGLGSAPEDGDRRARSQFRDPESFDAWASRWRERLASQGRPDAERQAEMRQVNPAYVLRNHLAQEAVDAAVERMDFGPMERLREALSRPYDDQPENTEYARPPREEDRVTQTFCGT